MARGLPYRKIWLVTLIRASFGPITWVSIVAWIAANMYVDVFVSPLPPHLFLLPVALLFVVMWIDWRLGLCVARFFSDALVELADEIAGAFDGKGDSWNNGAKRAKCAAKLFTMADVTHLALGKNAFSRNVRTHLRDVAVRVQAQAGSWEELRGTIVSIRECARKGSVSSSKCAPEVGGDARKRPLLVEVVLALATLAFWMTMLLRELR